MSYAYGMRFDDDSNAITVIDEENQTATTTGYINGEPVEFAGGGSSDFSTAEVTLTVPEQALSQMYPAPFPIIKNNSIILGAYMQTSASETYIVPLYEGKLEFFDRDGFVVDSGAASIDNDMVTVTGDCAISFS